MDNTYEEIILINNQILEYITQRRTINYTTYKKYKIAINMSNFYSFFGEEIPLLSKSQYKKKKEFELDRIELTLKNLHSHRDTLYKRLACNLERHLE